MMDKFICWTIEPFKQSCPYVLKSQEGFLMDSVLSTIEYYFIFQGDTFCVGYHPFCGQYLIGTALHIYKRIVEIEFWRRSHVR